MKEHTVVVVMGVSGAGKSTVAALLAERLGVPLAEADEFHPPANIALMSAGIPLSDGDRLPWLATIADWVAEHSRTGGGVVTCSALKRSYRDLLRQAAPDQVWFLHLHGDRALLADRMTGRAGHFMPVRLLDSQLADLQPLAPDEPGVEVDVAMSPAEIIDTTLRALDRPT
ncbi:Gluconokinase [Alloactinosynnema sp. L-07]|uniref:gluconokinase n=1 Tax=Alloactinosynnema sp. L-07 TaxID=1653480 RepID=UPI00065EFE41|nr:gluconokinase [Alloactinosynnema sp. L-07]CRK56488.1 Gluconokinase [Alloactinosynnema sp. L-07]